MSLNIGFSLLLPLNVASCAKTGSSRDNCVQSENLGRRCFFDLLIAVQRPQLIPLCSGIGQTLNCTFLCPFVQCSIQYKHEQCTQEFCWPEPLSTQVGANSFGPLLVRFSNWLESQLEDRTPPEGIILKLKALHCKALLSSKINFIG